ATLAQTFTTSQTFAQSALAAVNIAGLPSVQVPIELPEVLELTTEELLNKVGIFVDKAILAKLKQELDDFLRDPANTLGVKDTYEYCIDTEGMYVEANVSKCSPCDQTELELRQLEVEKAKVELELKRRELEEKGK